MRGSTPTLLDTLPFEQTSLISVAWNSVEDSIAVANGSNVDIWEWDVSSSSYNKVKTLIGHTDDVLQIDWKNDVLASLSYDNTIRIWDAVSWDLVEVLPLGEGFEVKKTMALSPDGTQIAYSGVDGALEIEATELEVTCGQHHFAWNRRRCEWRIGIFGENHRLLRHL
jgi:WD40 repeat protein